MVKRTGTLKISTPLQEPLKVSQCLETSVKIAKKTKCTAGNKDKKSSTGKSLKIQQKSDKTDASNKVQTFKIKNKPISNVQESWTQPVAIKKLPF